MSESIDPENIRCFSMPENLLEQVFEFTGGADHSKGFILAYADQNGKPLIYINTQNQIVEMGLRKSLEKYLIGVEEAEAMSNLENEDPDLD
jgi:hypothetical protein